MRKFILSLAALVCAGLHCTLGQEGTKADPEAKFFQLDSIVADMESNDKRWVSFLKGQNVLTGLYYLRAGDEDRQRPHDTDEVYYVLQGKAKFTAGGQETTVAKGSVLFVKAKVDHKFTEITEDLQVLVFFDQ